MGIGMFFVTYVTGMFQVPEGSWRGLGDFIVKLGPYEGCEAGVAKKRHLPWILS